VQIDGFSFTRTPSGSPKVELSRTIPAACRRLEGTNAIPLQHRPDGDAQAVLKPYQRIIGMGLPVVPLILEELRREPDQWFWALEAITDENPVPAEDAGNVRAMADAWIEWGRQHGHLPK
jgi:hypothetical protein